MTLLALFALILVIKLPVSDTRTVIERIIEGLEHWHLMGWALSILTTATGFWVNRNQKDTCAREVDRVSEEKTRLHEMLMNIKLESSNPKK